MPFVLSKRFKNIKSWEGLYDNTDPLYKSSVVNLKVKMNILKGLELLQRTVSDKLKKIPGSKKVGSAFILNKFNLVFKKAEESELLLFDKISSMILDGDINFISYPERVLVDTKEFQCGSTSKISIEDKVDILKESHVYSEYIESASKFDDLVAEFAKFISLALDRDIHIEDIYYLNEYLVNDATVKNPAMCLNACIPRFDNLCIFEKDNKMHMSIIDLEGNEDDAPEGTGNIVVKDYSCLFVFFPRHYQIIIDSIESQQKTISFQEKKRYKLISDIASNALILR